MAHGSLRGHRIGAGPLGEQERGQPAARVEVSFWCASGHRTTPSFSLQAEIPQVWECPRCGLLAGPDQDNPPEPTSVAPYKTHMAYVRERRTDADGEILLNEALARLRARG